MCFPFFLNWAMAIQDVIYKLQLPPFHSALLIGCNRSRVYVALQSQRTRSRTVPVCQEQEDGGSTVCVVAFSSERLLQRRFFFVFSHRRDGEKMFYRGNPGWDYDHRWVSLVTPTQRLMLAMSCSWTLADRLTTAKSVKQQLFPILKYLKYNMHSII